MTKFVIDTNEVFELEEAAKQLDIGIATLFRWLKAGAIIPLKIQGRTYITKSEIERKRKEKPDVPNRQLHDDRPGNEVDGRDPVDIAGA